MTRFEPLAKEMNSELVATMLDAARTEVASDRALARTFAALGVGIGLTSAASALKADALSTASHAASGSGAAANGGSLAGGATSGTLPAGSIPPGAVVGGAVKSGLGAKVAMSLAGSSATKWAATMGAVAILGYGINNTLQSSGERNIPPAVPVSDPPATVLPPVPERVVLPEPDPAVGEPAPAQAIVREAPTKDPHTPSDRAQPEKLSRLAREVKLIDAARAALAAHKPAQAVRLARQYQREYPRGRLLPEALYLRMEGNLALGRGPAAEQDARRLRSFGKHSAHEPRAREVLSGE